MSCLQHRSPTTGIPPKSKKQKAITTANEHLITKQQQPSNMPFTFCTMKSRFHPSGKALPKTGGPW